MSPDSKLLLDIFEWLDDKTYPDIDRGTRMDKIRERILARLNASCTCDREHSECEICSHLSHRRQ